MAQTLLLPKGPLPGGRVSLANGETRLPNGRASIPTGRTLLPTRRSSLSSGRTLPPAGRAVPGVSPAAERVHAGRGNDISEELEELSRIAQANAKLQGYHY